MAGIAHSVNIGYRAFCGHPTASPETGGNQHAMPCHDAFAGARGAMASMGPASAHRRGARGVDVPVRGPNDDAFSDQAMARPA